MHVGNMALLPLRTKFKGPAPVDRKCWNPIQIIVMTSLSTESDFDIIDEALNFFKANVFFRNYEIKVQRPLSYNW